MYAVQCETFLGRFVTESHMFTISAPKFFEAFRKSNTEFNCFIFDLGNYNNTKYIIKE